MTKTIKIRNGVIVLPPALRRALGETELRVREDGRQVILEGSAVPLRKVNLSSWKKAAGILKGRGLVDPVRWQRVIRREWERRLV